MPVISSEMLIYRLLGLNFMLVLRQLTDLSETAMASYLPFFLLNIFLRHLKNHHLLIFHL